MKFSTILAIMASTITVEGIEINQIKADSPAGEPENESDFYVTPP